MNRILVNILKEELNNVLIKQNIFKSELDKIPSGYITISKIHGEEYIYRKERINNKLVSSYIGKAGSEKANQAISQRVEYLKLQESLKELRAQEQDLRKVLNIYARRERIENASKNPK